MIHDRGRIKWVSMMLPEHVKVLREWAEEDSYETKKELDEQQLEIMNERIAEAMEYGTKVTIVHFHDRKYECLVGYIRGWDYMNGRLHVIDCFDEEHRMERQNIMDVQHAD